MVEFTTPDHRSFANFRPGPGAKNALQIMSLAAYASETNKMQLFKNLKIYSRLRYCGHPWGEDLI